MTRSPRIVTAGAGALLLAALAGCTPLDRASPTPEGPPSAAAPGETADAPSGERQLPADEWPDPCSLLTADEVGQLTGASVGEGEPGAPPVRDDGSEGSTPSYCTWSSAEGAGGELRVVDVVYPINEFFAALRLGFPPGGDLEDVGTEAFVAQRPDGAPVVIVCQGRTVFELSAPPGAQVDPAVFATLGSAAAGRVEGPAAESP